MKRFVLMVLVMPILRLNAQFYDHIFPSYNNDVECYRNIINTRLVELAPYLEPNTDDNILYVRINLFFMQKDDGNGNFHENDADEQSIINDAINDLNEIYANIVFPNSSSCFDGSQQEILHDSKIQFIANKYYIKNTNLWDNHHDNVLIPNINLNTSTYSHMCPGSQSWYLDSLDNAICNNESIPRGINIYFTESPQLYNLCWNLNNFDTTIYHNDFPGARGACSQYPNYNNRNRTSRIHMFELYSKYWWMKNVVPTMSVFNYPSWNPTVREWFYQTISRTLAHEIGHSLFLYHPIEDNLCYFHNDCYNAVMNPSGSAPHNFLHPKEIGMIYSTAMCSNVQAFIPNNTYLGNKFFSSCNIILPAYKIFHTLTLDNNADVTLNKDTTYVAQQVAINIGSDAILRLDHTNIKSYNDMWQGIVVNSGGTLLLTDVTIEDYDIIVQPNATLIIEDSLIVRGNHFIKVDANACLCINPSAKIVLEDPLSFLDISPNVNFGDCYAINNYNCLDNINDISYSGLGTIFNHISTIFIQNETISSQKLVTGMEVKVGRNVTSTKPEGSVIVTNGGSLHIRSDNGVTLDKDVNIQQGGQLIIY